MQRDGLLVPPRAEADCSEEQIGEKGDRCADQRDDPWIAECRVCRELPPGRVPPGRLRLRRVQL